MHAVLSISIFNVETYDAFVKTRKDISIADISTHRYVIERKMMKHMKIK